MTEAAAAAPYDGSFYAGQSAGSLRSARRIVPAALTLAPTSSVLDVGCGVGTFLSVFTEAGVSDVVGVDGDYVPRERLMIPGDRFFGRDLSRPLDMGRRFDLAMSLEVAEHIDESGADLFVENLCRHSNVVMFSAAIPEQGGTHHVNERWPSYWAAKFAARGYAVYDALRAAVWNDDSVEYWYRQNIMFFADQTGIARAPALAAARRDGPLDLVHPAMFASKAREAAQVRQALGLQTAIDGLIADGGAFSFKRGGDGVVSIVRAAG